MTEDLEPVLIGLRGAADAELESRIFGLGRENLMGWGGRRSGQGTWLETEYLRISRVIEKEADSGISSGDSTIEYCMTSARGG